MEQPSEKALDLEVYSTYINLTPAEHDSNFGDYLDLDSFIGNFYGSIPFRSELMNGAFTDDMEGNNECGVRFQ